MDLDLEVYKQCHEHLKETDKKRDQLVAAFTVVTGFVVSNLDKLKGQYLVPSLLGLGFTGICVLLTIVQYRKWHIIYVQCSQFVDIYIRESEKRSIADCVRIWEDYSTKRYKNSIVSWLNPFGSTEAAIFLFVGTVAFAPWHFLIVETGGLITLQTSICNLPTILNFFGFIVIAHGVLLATLSIASKEKLHHHWILLGLLKESKNNEKDKDAIHNDT